MAEIGPDERFADIVAALVGIPGVTPPQDETGSRRQFGSNGLKVRNKIFAMLVRGRLVVKLPRRRVDELVAGQQGERFDPGHGRLMKEWLALAPTSDREWLTLAQEALAFVSSQR